MYLIQDNTGKYCKTKPKGKPVFTPKIQDAHTFPSEREASDFLRKHWNKKTRAHFRVIQHEEYESEFQTVEILDKIQAVKSLDSDFSMTEMEKEIQSKLTEQVEIYKTDMKRAEGKLSDIQHFLLSPDTHLNVYQCYLTVQKLQEILRDRCESKKEFQRLCILRAETNKAFKMAENFEYDEYKNKVIEDVKEYLFADMKTNKNSKEVI